MGVHIIMDIDSLVWILTLMKPGSKWSLGCGLPELLLHFGWTEWHENQEMMYSVHVILGEVGWGLGDLSRICSLYAAKDPYILSDAYHSASTFSISLTLPCILMSDICDGTCNWKCKELFIRLVHAMFIITVPGHEPLIYKLSPLNTLLFDCS